MDVFSKPLSEVDPALLATLIGAGVGAASSKAEELPIGQSLSNIALGGLLGYGTYREIPEVLEAVENIQESGLSGLMDLSPEAMSRLTTLLGAYSGFLGSISDKGKNPIYNTLIGSGIGLGIGTLLPYLLPMLVSK